MPETIQGLKDLQKAFAAMEPKVSKKIQRKGMRKAAKPVLDAAKAKVPVDFGTLEDSIKIRAVKRSRKHFGVRVVTSDSDSLFAGETYYGGMVEYGTEHQDAQPFMRPAYDENKETVYRVFQQVTPPLIAEAAREARNGR